MPFEDAIASHLRPLMAYCRSLVRCGWDAEDLYQETLTRTFVYMREYEEPRHMRAFLRRTARNVWIDQYRRRRAAGRDGPDGNAGRPETYTFADGRASRDGGGETQLAASYAPRSDDVGYVDVRAAVETLAERLSAAQIELVLLAGHYGYSMPDIASLTGRTVSAVKCSLHRARSALRADRPAAGPRGVRSSAPPPARLNREIDYWSGQLLYHRSYRAYAPGRRAASEIGANASASGSVNARSGS